MPADFSNAQPTQYTPPTQRSTPWWQTLVISIANVAVSAAVQHFVGDLPAAGTLAAGTAIAHALPSPFRR